MDSMHISGQKEAIWNTLFSIIERLRPPNVAGPGKTPPFPSLDGPVSNLCDHNPPTSQIDRQTDGRHAIVRPRFAL